MFSNNFHNYFLLK